MESMDLHQHESVLDGNVFRRKALMCLHEVSILGGRRSEKFTTFDSFLGIVSRALFCSLLRLLPCLRSRHLRSLVLLSADPTLSSEGCVSVSLL